MVGAGGLATSSHEPEPPLQAQESSYFDQLPKKIEGKGPYPGPKKTRHPAQTISTIPKTDTKETFINPKQILYFSALHPEGQVIAAGRSSRELLKLDKCGRILRTPGARPARARLWEAIPRASSSIYIMPTFGPEVCKQDLTWTIWSPKVCKVCARLVERVFAHQTAGVHVYFAYVRLYFA